MSPRVRAWLPQPWRGAEGHTGNLRTARGGAELSGRLQQNAGNLKKILIIQSKEQGRDGRREINSRVTVSGGSSPRICVSCGVNPHPLPPLLLCPCSGKWQGLQRGAGGKVTPIWYTYISVVWDGGARGHVSHRISDETALSVMTLHLQGVVGFIGSNRAFTFKGICFFSTLLCSSLAGSLWRFIFDE